MYLRVSTRGHVHVRFMNACMQYGPFCVVTRRGFVRLHQYAPTHTSRYTYVGCSLHPSAVLGASCAVARAGAILGNVPLHQHIAALCSVSRQSFALPIPVVGAIGSGLVGCGKLRFLEFCLVPSPEVSTLEQVTNLTAIYRQIGEVLASKGGVSGLYLCMYMCVCLFLCGCVGYYCLCFGEEGDFSMHGELPGYCCMPLICFDLENYTSQYTL